MLQSSGRAGLSIPQGLACPAFCKLQRVLKAILSDCFEGHDQPCPSDSTLGPGVGLHFHLPSSGVSVSPLKSCGSKPARPCRPAWLLLTMLYWQRLEYYFIPVYYICNLWIQGAEILHSYNYLDFGLKQFILTVCHHIFASTTEQKASMKKKYSAPICRIVEGNLKSSKQSLTSG